MTVKFKKERIRLHVVSWDQCEEWHPSAADDLYSLCGEHVQRPSSRLASWVTPARWGLDINSSFYRCPDCSSHQDYPLLLLGAL